MTPHENILRVETDLLTLLALRVVNQKMHPLVNYYFDHPNPLSPNSDLTQISHCSIKSLSVREVMRIENMITQVKFY